MPVFTPPQATDEPRPVVFWLSGLTCTEDNFTVKAGTQRMAAELGLVIVAPDTSPRGDDVPDDKVRTISARAPGSIWMRPASRGRSIIICTATSRPSCRH